jgi:hypothetical protein
MNSDLRRAQSSSEILKTMGKLDGKLGCFDHVERSAYLNRNKIE